VDIDVERGADNYRAADVARLHGAGAVVISYLNVGAAEPFRAYWPGVRRFAVQSYQGYPGEFWMRVERAGYRRVLLEEAARSSSEPGWMASTSTTWTSCRSGSLREPPFAPSWPSCRPCGRPIRT
jgi:hypothetical protein